MPCDFMYAPSILLGDIDSDEPLKNLAAISLGFEHRCYQRLTLAGTDAFRGSSASPSCAGVGSRLRATLWITLWKSC
jgi:hypothetical protein